MMVSKDVEINGADVVVGVVSERINNNNHQNTTATTKHTHRVQV